MPVPEKINLWPHRCYKDVDEAPADETTDEGDER